jgi:hypothetical protein
MLAACRSTVEKEQRAGPRGSLLTQLGYDCKPVLAADVI